MKKNITLLASLLLVVFSVSAQSLYTTTGSDLTWEQVKQQKEIPKDIWGGLTGSEIDVNQDHPLISSSPYANRKIQEGTAIHTIANPTITKANFHKWSRWYQEDGNTQVFRMFKGEINVGNDIYYKPRVEAELNNHSKGLNINNGADWVEWSGTYTFVKPVEANIFQIWSNDDYVLMLVMKNNGLIQLNPRDGSGFRNILTDAAGKSVDIRVRDYGNKYEVYVNGEYFWGRSYTAKYGNNRAAHFRWGIYASRKNGDYGGVPQDGLMFVTGAQRRYSNDPDVDTKVDEITSITAPDAVTQGQTISVSVNYTTSASRDISAMLQLDGTPFTVATQSTKTVPAGTGTATFELEIPEDLTPLVGGYQYQTVLAPVGGGWADRLDNANKKGIDVLEAEKKEPFSGSPMAIPGMLEMEYYDKGGQGISYNDTDPENKGGDDFRSGDGVDIASKNGGKTIGYNADGEWLEYTVNVQQAGSYDMNITYASKDGGGKLGIDMDGTELMTGITVPNTGDWNVFDEFTKSVELPVGEHVLRFIIETRGFDLDRIQFESATVTSTESVLEIESLTVFPNPSEGGVFKLSQTVDYEIYDIHGIRILSQTADHVDLSSQPHGVYILHVGSKQVKLLR